MRQLMSTQHGQATASPAPVPACSTPSLSISTPPSPAPSSLPSSPSTPDYSSPSPTLSDDLAVENKLLREKIADLNIRVTVLLDHSIESDIRLLQYTDLVFVSNNSSSSHITAPRAAMTVDCATQCEPPIYLSNPDDTVVTVDTCVQYESLAIPAVCDSEQFCVNRDLVHSLKTTVEVLEAEIVSLKYELNLCKREERTNEDTWTKVQTKTSKVPAKSKSKYDDVKNKKAIIKTSNKKHTSQQKTIKKQYIGFNTVVIRGDSHAHYIAGLLGEMVNSEVTGVCKPGARLCDVIDHSPTPPVAVTRCEPANTSMVISTLPYRHDLPGDEGTNQDIGLVNAYIQELAVRHDARFLDFNQLDRKMFTRHGMHLSQRGKRKLAGLIQRSLAKIQKLTSRPSPKVPPPSSGEPPSSTMQSPSVATAEPRCLPMTVVPCVPPSPATPWTSPHNSYAEAVRSPPPYERSTVVVDEKSNSVFLGTPLGNSGQN
ncbi:hypothetical protein J6590_064511 [Homalodisca vitripennis]|nr:hypothetical protein J6590_064511 [Homalodisca vitripennis]